MILIFDYFETIIHNKSMDFNRGLKAMWEKYYKDKCSFEEISKYGDELFLHMQNMHMQGLEYAFVKDELPKYAEKLIRSKSCRKSLEIYSRISSEFVFAFML